METARVMVCEDEQLFALDLKARLEQFGYIVTGIAPSGREAIELAQKTCPDLALMDIRLNGVIAGTEVAKVLKNEFGIPSIYLTAYTDKSTVEEAKQAAPLGYLIKPVGDTELKTTLEVGLFLHQQQQQLLKQTTAQLQELRGALFQKGINPDQLKEVTQLLHTEREKTIADISGGVAHHLNNALTGIVGSLEWLRHCGTLPEFELRFVNSALTGCREAAGLVQSLLWASGNGFFQLDSCRLQDLIEEAVNAVRTKIHSSVKVLVRHTADSLYVMADRIALKQALQEVILNASEAAKESGEVMITVSKEYHETPQAHNKHAKPGWYAMVKIKDTGRGMTEDLLEQALQPFFTGHGNPRRHGMGLAIVQGVTNALGGWFEIESEVQVGTLVKLYFPLSERKINQSTTFNTSTTH